MTTNMTGIDIRKALLKAHINPSSVNEDAIWEVCDENCIDDWEIDGEIETLAKEARI